MSPVKVSEEVFRDQIGACLGQEMVATYTTRVAMRSLYKVLAQRRLQARKAAELYCGQLLTSLEALRLSITKLGWSKKCWKTAWNAMKLR